MYTYSDPKIVSTTTKRVFRVCKVCKHRETIDYTLEICEMIWKGSPERFYREYRMDGDTRIEHSTDRNRRCSNCGAWASDGYKSNFTERTLKTVKLDETHICDDRCKMATSDTCVCSCGGEYHGIAHKHA